ncbi:MAG: hypothetical protein IH996_08145 [Proteobacteria bacterium]|nr:hypothetical protein [Pseudomonadota bacterium]
MGQLFEELKRRNVVRVGIAYLIFSWVLIEVSDTIAPMMTLPEWAPSLVLYVLIIGFPVALFFSWAYELTPEGVKKTHEVDADASITHSTGRKLDRMIIGALVVAVAFLIYDRVSGPQVPKEPAAEAGEVTADAESNAPISIAVLPFVNMSADPDQEYFSDGISEELLNVLAKVPGLRVAARTSSFQFKGENRDVVEIARQLRVAHVIEGSVRKSGTRLRITAQLIDAEEGFHIWSETYDRELDDIFAIQDEIAAAIVEALVERLGLTVATVPKVQTAANTESYDEYLLGIHQMERRGVGPLAASIEHFEKSLTLDPDYAPAMARLAMSYMLITTYSSDYILSEALAKAGPLVERAMELAPGLAEVHAATAIFHWNQNNWTAAEGELKRAIAINPSYATVYNWLAQLQKGLGRPAEQLKNYERAVRSDPLSVLSLGNMVEVYASHGRLTEARALTERLKGLSPWHYHSARADISAAEGRWADQALALLEALAVDPENTNSKAPLSLVLALGLGLPEEALKFGERMAVPLIMLDRRNEAVDRLEHIYKNINPFVGAAYAWALQEAGRDDESLAMYEVDFAEFMQGTGGRGFYGHWDLQTFAVARRRAGDEAGAMQLLERSLDGTTKERDAGIDNPDLDLDRGAALYLMGQTEAGLALIARGVQNGGLLAFFSVHLEPLYTDPGFAPIRAQYEARSAAERDKFLKAVCNDGNPAPEAWTPMPGTCEDYVEG